MVEWMMSPIVKLMFDVLLHSLMNAIIAMIADIVYNALEYYTHAALFLSTCTKIELKHILVFNFRIKSVTFNP